MTDQFTERPTDFQVVETVEEDMIWIESLIVTRKLLCRIVTASCDGHLTTRSVIATSGILYLSRFRIDLPADITMRSSNTVGVVPGFRWRTSGGLYCGIEHWGVQLSQHDKLCW